MTSNERSSQLGIVLALASALACGRSPSPPPSPPAGGPLPLGPGPLVQLGISGRASLSPSLATRDAFAAIAWTATAPDGRADVYVVTSIDGGATFSQPLRIGETNADADSPSHIVFEWPRLDEGLQSLMPDIRVEWTLRERGRVVQRAARSTDGGGTFLRDPDDRVHLFYTGGLDVPLLPVERVIGANAGFLAIGHSQVTRMSDGTVVAVWDEAGGVGHRVMLRRALIGLGNSVQKIDAFALAESAGAVSPIVSAIDGGVIVAWASGSLSTSMIVVRRVGLDPLCATPPVRLQYQEFPHGLHD